ncbi:MAG: hypothetical protein WKF96_16585 [Solirubrobacteraceae bacterium]
MTADLAGVGNAARALHDAYGPLLTREPSGESIEQTRAVEALDAARDRLRGGERPGADQLTLDVRTR